jgi:hypothetical protein
VTAQPGQLPAAQPLAPIKRISPSRFIGLQRCRLRGLWAAQRVEPLLPVSARARLGTVVHRVFERVGRDALTVEQVTPHVWNEELRFVEGEMEASWLDRSLVPLHKAVADAEVQKLRALERARTMAAALPQQREGTGGTKGIGFELWVQSSDESVGGYLDCAIRSDGLVIRDYKSGAILEKDDDEQSRIKDEYVVQLQLYAALYNETFGVWPDRLEIVPVQGDAVTVPVDRLKCTELVRDAKVLLSEVNAAVDGLGVSGAPDTATLAQPTARVCATCAYRPHCRTYLAANADMHEQWPLDICGNVTRIQKLGNGSLALGLTDHCGRIHSIKGLMPGERHPALKMIDSGSAVGLFNLQRSYPARGLSEGPYTTLYKMTEQT